MIGYRRGAARVALPLGGDVSAYFLPWIFALMAYLAALATLGLIVLDRSLSAAERLLAANLTIEVPADTSPARLETVLALLKQTAGVTSAHLLDSAETARLLEPWLGPSVRIDDLPVPRLIDLRVNPDGGTDFAALRRQLTSVVPEARLDDQGAWFDGMRAAVRPIEGVLAAVIAVALLISALSALCVARFSLIVHHRDIELLYLLGAADADIARPFAMRCLRLGLLGGAVGAIAVILTVWVLGGADRIMQLPTPIATVGFADWQLWAVLAGAALAAALLAMASAWMAVLRRLADMP